MRHIRLLKKTLYERHLLIAFLDGFRLSRLYSYAFKHCDITDAYMIYEECLLIERDMPLLNNVAVENHGFLDLVKTSLLFVRPSIELMIESFSYISLSMAYISVKTGHKFLLSKYILEQFDLFLETDAYKKIYNERMDLRTIVCDSIHDCAYACGETDSASSRLQNMIMKNCIVDI